jgi:hypothetical protein
LATCCSFRIIKSAHISKGLVVASIHTLEIITTTHHLSNVFLFETGVGFVRDKHSKYEKDGHEVNHNSQKNVS